MSQTNNQTKDQLSTKSQTELIQIIKQQEDEHQAVFNAFKKSSRAAILYWVMQDLFALRAITDPTHYFDQVHVLSRRFAGWGDRVDVEPFNVK